MVGSLITLYYVVKTTAQMLFFLYLRGESLLWGIKEWTKTTLWKLSNYSKLDYIDSHLSYSTVCI